LAVSARDPAAPHKHSSPKGRDARENGGMSVFGVEKLETTEEIPNTLK